jgi:anti-sigma-K factor RskA
MNWEQKIERLAARAQAESTPRVDVTQNVLHILTAGPAQPLTATERLWLWLAAVTSAVAVPAAAAAIILYIRSTGPLNEIAEAISWAIQ